MGGGLESGAGGAVRRTAPPSRYSYGGKKPYKFSLQW